MKESRFANMNVPSSRLGQIRDYLGQHNSRSLGDAWDHKTWGYELFYPDDVVRCKSFEDVLKSIKERGETTKHLTHFESRTGRILRFDATNPSEIVLAVENGGQTDAMMKRVAEIMSLVEFPRRVFVTHGHSPVWREVAEFIDKECNPRLPVLELSNRANKGRTLIEKLDGEAAHCGYAVVIMTGDDVTDDGEIRARENVVHELGFFQGRYGRSRVCLLHEEDVNIPSNLGGIAYCAFPRGKVASALIELQRDLAAAFPQ